MIPDDELTPPCRGKGYLFESVLTIDHRLAAEMCERCPLALFAACQRLAAEQTNHDGTWAGVLYVNGHPSKRAPRKAA